MKLISLLFTLFLFLNSFARESVSANRFEILTGIKKSKNLKSYWDKKYSGDEYVYGKTPAKFLAANFQYILSGARVLDVGMGEGRNAVFLARHGFKVTGIDISPVATRKANLLAKEFDVSIETITVSANKFNPPKSSFDAIICFYYLDRSLVEKMISWLKPGGIIIYESYTELQKQVKMAEPVDDGYLLKQGELLHLFKPLRILKYEEPLHMPEFISSIILQKA